MDHHPTDQASRDSPRSPRRRLAASRSFRARAERGPRVLRPAGRRATALRCPARCSQSRLAGRPTRAKLPHRHPHRVHMVPMRSVPHRVVCLVGLDDGVYPRTTSVDGDDVLGPAPADRERDVRSEDRQLLASTPCWPRPTMSVITYTGAKRALRRPPTPAVPPRRDPGRRRPHHRRAGARADPHPAPLQPYDARNLNRRGAGGRPTVSAFDTAALAGASGGLGSSPRARPPLVAGAAPDPAGRGRLAGRPEGLLRPSRSRVSSGARLDCPRRSSPTSWPTRSRSTSTALELWQVGATGCLSEILAGQDRRRWMLAEHLRGQPSARRAGRAGVPQGHRGVPEALGA